MFYLYVCNDCCKTNSVALQSIKKEIERRLDCIQRIAYEPQLIWDDDSRYILRPDTTLPPFYYRLKAVDDIKILGRQFNDLCSSKLIVNTIICNRRERDF